jgi:hypothetical protein
VKASFGSENKPLKYNQYYSYEIVILLFSRGLLIGIVEIIKRNTLRIDFIFQKKKKKNKTTHIIFYFFSNFF